MKFRLAAILALVFSSFGSYSQVMPYGNIRDYADRPSREYREALRLYNKGMYDRSMLLFKEIAGTTGEGDAYGYYVLNAACLEAPGYERLIEDFVSRYQSSGLIPQIRYRYALNLFDGKDFNGASAQFEQISRHQLYRSQVPEFQFKRAYCDFELRYLDRALLRFKDLTMRAHSDYTAPAQYAIGYIYYEREDFSEAVPWLEEAAQDSRFTEIASFYLVECRFMLKDYDTVAETGPGVMEMVSEDKKPYLARFISESCLVLGDTGKAREYYDLSRKSLSPSSRTDYFYAGSVLYAVKDYQGAIGNFSMMQDRTDSLGQIANYHLGYSYIRTGNKVAAMGAFRDASEAGFDQGIKEDAFFNYAKLAFDLNTDTSVFYDYLREYKDTGKRELIYSYIAIAALYNRDYAGAIAAYDEIDELDPDMKSNYMKANYLRANQLMLSGSYRAAAECLRAAGDYSERRTYFNQMSRYWLGEAYYKSGQYEKAIDVFMDLYNTSALYGKEESKLVPFNIAYCYLMMNDYNYAANWFSTYLSEPPVSWRKEAMLRYGDCMFMQQRYKDAVEAYDGVLKDYFDVNDIYPYYQSAVSYGLSGNNARKVSLLSNVRKASPSSYFYPEAMYELGRSLVAVGKPDEAAECFNTLAANVRDSIYIARSYIELGMIYRNRSDNAKALSYYKKVVEDMPLSEYADAALLAIESIYKSQNAPEEYLAYIESIGKSSLKTEAEKEMMIYNAGEQIFLSENYPKAIASLGSYLEKYPSGKMVTNAEYYLGECYRLTGQPEAACDHYARVMSAGTGPFLDQASLNYADLSYSMQKYADAYTAYSALNGRTGDRDAAFRSLVGMMRSAFRGRMYDEAISSSWRLGKEPGLAGDLLRESEYVRAKSLLATSRRDEAFVLLARLAEAPSTPEGAEAAYLMIQDNYDRGEFQKVEEMVYAFSDSGTGENYWLAKAFIVLGDAFVEMDNPEQARATFESIAEGYSPEGGDDDVLQTVRMRLEKLGELMAGSVE